MKRSVLGIIFVFCLQLGFVAYTAIDRPFEALVGVNEVTSGTDTLAIAPDLSDGAEIAVSTPDRRKSTLFARADLVSSKSVVKVPASKAVNGGQQFVASRNSSEIRLRTEYPQAMPLDRESKDYQLSASVIQRSKKRSFFSKSVSVLKKPYDWLKTLGSTIK